MVQRNLHLLTNTAAVCAAFLCVLSQIPADEAHQEVDLNVLMGTSDKIIVVRACIGKIEKGEREVRRGKLMIEGFDCSSSLFLLV